MLSGSCNPAKISGASPLLNVVGISAMKSALGNSPVGIGGTGGVLASIFGKDIPVMALATGKDTEG